MSRADRLMSWGMPLLYTGPAFELPAHRKGVGLLCAGLDGALDVSVGEAGQDRRRLSCDLAYVEPGVTHHITFQAGTIACLYVDPESGLARSIIAAMRSEGAGLHSTHHRRSAVLDALGDDRPVVRRDRLGQLLGLTSAISAWPDPRLRAVRDAVLSDPSEPHGVKALTRRSGLSESRLRHAFRDAAGLPLKRFRLWARMGSALRLIGQGSSLTAAAHEAGFSSSAHFSSAYRAMFGIKPSLVVRANPMLRPAADLRPRMAA